MIPFGRKKKQVLLDTSRNDYEFVEETKKNPSRGFYQVYPFDLSCDIDEKYLDTTMQTDDTICLIEVCLKAYREEQISQEGCNHLHRILTYFRNKNKDLIVRFTYDLDGHAAESEPTSIDKIQLHMRQTLNIIEQYQDIIILMQGLYVGNWGEMHSSRYATDNALKVLYETYRMSEAGHIYLAVRTPGMIQILLKENPRIQKRMKQDEELYQEHLRHLDKIGLFDDALLYSEDDCGTFHKNQLSKEIQYIQKNVIKVPVGGEVLKGDAELSQVKMLNHLETLHINYLNRQYDRNLLDRWKEIKYGDTTFYDYVEKHLGYAIHLDEITYDPKEYELNIRVINLGFGAMIETAECRVLIEQEWTEMNMETGEIEHGLHMEQQAHYRIRHASVQSGSTQNWTLKLNPLKKGKYRISIKMVRFKDQRPIYFTNLKPEEMFRLPMEQP